MRHCKYAVLPKIAVIPEGEREAASRSAAQSALPAQQAQRGQHAYHAQHGQHGQSGQHAEHAHHGQHAPRHNVPSSPGQPRPTSDTAAVNTQQQASLVRPRQLPSQHQHGGIPTSPGYIHPFFDSGKSQPHQQQAAASASVAQQAGVQSEADEGKETAAPKLQQPRQHAEDSPGNPSEQQAATAAKPALQAATAKPAAVPGDVTAVQDNPCPEKPLQQQAATVAQLAQQAATAQQATASGGVTDAQSSTGKMFQQPATATLAQRAATAQPAAARAQPRHRGAVAAHEQQAVNQHHANGSVDPSSEEGRRHGADNALATPAVAIVPQAEKAQQESHQAQHAPQPQQLAERAKGPATEDNQ